MIKTILHFPYFLYVITLFVVLILLSFPFTLLLLLFPTQIKDWGMFWLMKIISNIWFCAIGMPPTNYNRNKIDFSKSYLITPNHQSFLDAVIIYTSIPTLFKTLGKKEIEKTPIYGIIYKTVVITVDRSSMTARAVSLRKMKNELDEGKSIVVFPEGTFPSQPSPLLSPFVQGGFALALMQQVDILPILYLDSSTRMHPSKLIRFKPGRNRAVYLPPMQVSWFGKKDTDGLKQKTQDYMQACLDYCRLNKVSEVWNFANQWQTQNLEKI
jgi:1-acyl-sn-glycerol-3-phosphate acyltransferase